MHKHKREHGEAQSFNRTSKIRVLKGDFFPPLEVVALSAQKRLCGEINLQNPPIKSSITFNPCWNITWGAKQEKNWDNGEEKCTYQNTPDNNPGLCPSMRICPPDKPGWVSVFYTNVPPGRKTSDQQYLEPLLLPAYLPLSEIQFTPEMLLSWFGSEMNTSVKADRVPLIFIASKKRRYEILQFSVFPRQHSAQWHFTLST